MDKFELEIISGILDGRITDINTFMVAMGELKPSSYPPQFNSAQLLAPDGGSRYVLKTSGTAYIPNNFDEMVVRTVRFRKLLLSLVNAELIALITKPDDSLNTIGTICLLYNHELYSAFYKDNWDLLFKKILPLPGLTNLYQQLTAEPRPIGFDPNR